MNQRSDPRTLSAASNGSGVGESDESLDALRGALEDLRVQIRSQLSDRSNLRDSAPQFDWMGLLDELRRRLGTFGMAERSGEVDEFGMDPAVLNRARALLDFLYERYWRIDVRGLERVPVGGPSLIAANRSGLLPYDGLMLAHLMAREFVDAPRPRFLVADWLITLPFAQPSLSRLGGVRACRENADRLLRDGHTVIAFPEGAKGAAKAFRERYQIKRFGRGGVVRTAIENGVPLVPVGFVGPEEAHPILFKSHGPARLLGLPFVPVTPTFPHLGPLGLVPLPTQWVVIFGEPIHFEERGPDAVRDELLVSRLTEELRAGVQQLVTEGLELRPSVWG